MIPFPASNARSTYLAQAFAGHLLVDIVIQCAIEGRDVSVLVDDPKEPSFVFLEASGLLSYFAGDAQHPQSRRAVQRLTGPRIVMPSPDPWVELLYDVHGEAVRVTDRYRLSSEYLSPDHLASIVDKSPMGDLLRPAEPATLSASCELYGEIPVASDSAIAGLVFCAMDGETLLGAAYPSLACSTAIEVSIFVTPDYRRRGIATLLGASLASAALRRDLEPHWDAANPESCRLALKLGYKYLGSYEAHYFKGSGPNAA